MPHMFGGNEVPPDVMAAPRAVAAPSAELQADTTYPRLGDIPAKPKDFPPPQALDLIKRDLARDRAEGNALKQQYELSVTPPMGTP